MPHTLTLLDGLNIGETVHRDAELIVPTAGAIMDAAREAEVVITGPDGRLALATSPSLLAYGLLRRQVVRIGDYPGPLALAVLAKLSARDLELLQVAAGMLDIAEGADLDRIVAEAQARGRSDGARRQPA